MKLIKHMAGVLLVLFYCISLSVSLAAHAQDADGEQPEQQPRHITSWLLQGYLENLSLDKRAAFSQGVEPDALVLGFGVEHHTTAHRNNIALGLAFIVYDDNAAFRQQVRSSWGGGARNASSEASAMQLYAEFGPRFNLGSQQRYYAIVRGGLTLLLASDRTIPNCSNCYSEKIDLDGGIYGLAGIGVDLNTVSWSLRYKHFLSGDLDSAISVMLSQRF